MEEEAFRKIAVDYLPSVFKTLMILEFYILYLVVEN